ncbi:molybdenum cofactor biosynthesis protein [Sulfolobus sp. A20]|uniref:MogA/MoaB family molybdenum cofactor biosynthesis protein n=1 Tax=Sulfolobaceae TaxID=118883 RepID=UPI000845DE51|nr:MULTISPECIES: molybdenum cofactor biosynthesis protein B [unclassified Sulfolobus]TRM73739.1 molybdenum cofactor biosynthesis protein MoaB [Sulfolobus sp. E5]TRM76898.1 molybdenum cofactor biosynthesis protein MoaB [Sulfolobus sp. B5]TRM77367.1 molybdenum cofactor biosynthesis protein MoaB [Sulfolobus sp. A20-N-F8]TRM80996.1 molybdenum cofactor biosynthesis protein MoaB [Sulfolobus sp. D5]TRM85255.1 molybdenum cofactor biosynthesis protein MoaB [Sulfolobus sp. F3]TRM86228.1 molybdenum cofa
MTAHKEHRLHAPKNINFYVITISTSRYEKLIRKEPVVDESGDIIKQLIISSGYTVVGYDLIPDDKIKILKAFVLALENPQVDVIISTGGTGYSLTDVTVETIRPLFDREIEGFSDIFRLVSYNDPEVKSASYLTKATAGIIGDKILYLLPGSPDAVKLAMKELILPEIGHLIYIARRK